jgi:hypothetical protein
MLVLAGTLNSEAPAVLANGSMAGLLIPAFEESSMPSRFARFILDFALVFALVLVPLKAQAQQSQAPTTSSTSTKLDDTPRGKKLILKDGTYQVVREYQRNGDRVRYFSLERGDWEEIPAAIVDWDATAKDEATTTKANAATLDKLHKQEEAKRMDNVADIDASLQVGEGAFLPSGEGLFVVEGKSVRLLQQAGARGKTDTLRTVEQIISPVPIVPGKQKVLIQGEHATIRLHSSSPEFYLREPPPDPDRVSPILKSSRPGESGPDVVLIKAKVVHNGRQLEAVKTLFGQEVGRDREEISVQRWEVAPAVYRFTLSQALPPGEYVLAEVLDEGLNFYVWDFGVDASVGAAKGK